MAIAKLPTNYADEVVSGERKYRQINNQDGTVSFEDESTYTTQGSQYGATDLNLINATVNELIDLSEDNLDTLSSTNDKITRIVNGNTVAARATRADTASSADTASNALSAGSANNDFILVNKQALTFSNNVCRLLDDRITADSLADVYFTTSSLNAAQKAVISVETGNGYVTLTAGRTPDSTLTASIRIRVV